LEDAEEERLKAMKVQSFNAIWNTIVSSLVQDTLEELKKWNL
jgi:hypothetical protein